MAEASCLWGASHVLQTVRRVCSSPSPAQPYTDRITATLPFTEFDAVEPTTMEATATTPGAAETYSSKPIAVGGKSLLSTQ